MKAPDYSIPENWDRIFILDDNERPVRVFDFGVKVDWQLTAGKRYELRDEMPEYGVVVQTYFSCWASMHDDKQPTFWTTLKGNGLDHIFHSSTWEEAQDKHRRVIEKVRRKLPHKGAVSDGA
ncbi:hypothetical protein LJR296_008165 [Cupriavidus necator]|uniref:hypothetical protein n=1 Tax=Cupriavidus necator TaxID=106590 RepID=UPI003ED0D0BF